MGFFDKTKTKNNEDDMNIKKDVNIEELFISSVDNIIGKEIYAIECKGAILYVHEKAVIINKKSSGFLEKSGNFCKVIPLKSIIAVKFNYDEPHSYWNIEIETAYYNAVNTSNGSFPLMENCVVLKDIKSQVNQVNEALKYIIERIV